MRITDYSEIKAFPRTAEDEKRQHLIGSCNWQKEPSQILHSCPRVDATLLFAISDKDDAN